jgi:hypothetical protein
LRRLLNEHDGDQHERHDDNDRDGDRADGGGARSAQSPGKTSILVVEERRENGRPGQRSQERLEQPVHQVAEEKDAAVEDKRRAPLARDLIGHRLRI